MLYIDNMAVGYAGFSNQLLLVVISLYIQVSDSSKMVEQGNNLNNYLEDCEKMAINA